MSKENKEKEKKKLKIEEKSNLSDKRKLLLLRGLKNNFNIGWNEALQLYSGKQTAKSALASMEYQGYIKRKVPGSFEVTKVPKETWKKFEEFKEDEEKEDDKND